MPIQNRADPERRSDDSIRVSVLWSALLLMRWRVYGKVWNMARH